VSRHDLAIDLGTVNTLVYVKGRGVVYEEPTVVAVHSRTGEVVAVGRDAWSAGAETPAMIMVVRPIQRGVITDFDVARRMLRAILRRIGVGRFPKPRVMVCVPSSLTPVERRAVEDSVAGAGARSVAPVDEPLAAAVGAGLPIQEAVGNMIVDVGGGTSEMAMVALGGLVVSRSIGAGSQDMDVAILQHLRRRYDVAIGETTAERIKIELGSAYPASDAPNLRVRGREVSTGLALTVTITPEEVREVLGDTVRTIVDSTRQCLAESPPELAHDVLETGLFLTGGGALLRGLDMRLAQDCEVPVHVAEQPLTTVVTGAGHLLDYLPQYHATFLGGGR
jgi:rod shape-determining protein MreB and related proteins